MRQKSNSTPASSETLVRNIRLASKYSKCPRLNATVPRLHPGFCVLQRNNAPMSAVRKMTATFTSQIASVCGMYFQSFVSKYPTVSHRPINNSSEGCLRNRRDTFLPRQCAAIEMHAPRTNVFVAWLATREELDADRTINEHDLVQCEPEFADEGRTAPVRNAALRVRNRVYAPAEPAVEIAGENKALFLGKICVVIA